MKEYFLGKWHHLTVVLGNKWQQLKQNRENRLNLRYWIKTGKRRDGKAIVFP